MKLDKGMILQKKSTTNYEGMNNLPNGTKIALIDSSIGNNVKSWRIEDLKTNIYYAITEQKLLTPDWNVIEVTNIEWKPKPKATVKGDSSVTLNKDVYVNTTQGIIVLDSLSDEVSSQYEGEFTCYPAGTSFLSELWNSCKIHGNKISH